MNRIRWIGSALLFLGVLTVSGCTDGDATDRALAPGPEDGSLAVVLDSPAEDDGAVLFVLEGGAVENVRAAREDLAVYPERDGDGWTVAVLGTGLSGELVRFDVPDVSLVSTYQVTLTEVADEGNDLRRDISGHALRVTTVR